MLSREQEIELDDHSCRNPSRLGLLSLLTSLKFNEFMKNYPSDLFELHDSSDGSWRDRNSTREFKNKFLCTVYYPRYGTVDFVVQSKIVGDNFHSNLEFQREKAKRNSSLCMEPGDMIIQFRLSLNDYTNLRIQYFNFIWLQLFYLVGIIMIPTSFWYSLIRGDTRIMKVIFVFK